MDILGHQSVLSEQLSKPMGLVIHCGTRFSNTTAVIEEALKNLHGKKIHSFSKPQMNVDADIVIVDTPLNKELFYHMLDFCDEGRMVLLRMSAPSVMASLHKIFELCSVQENEHLLWRVLEHLKLVIHQVDILGLQGEKIQHFEFLINNPENHELLRERKLKKINELLLKTQEASGILTLNQSLLSSLIKRKIDLKSAFLWSRDPEDLDLLLKRVGV